MTNDSLNKFLLRKHLYVTNPCNNTNYKYLYPYVYKLYLTTAVSKIIHLYIHIKISLYMVLMIEYDDQHT